MQDFINIKNPLAGDSHEKENRVELTLHVNRLYFRIWTNIKM